MSLRSVVLAFFSLVSFTISYGQWTQNGFVQDGSISMPAPNVVYDSYGTYIQKTVNGGSTWTNINKTNFTNYNAALPFVFQTSSVNVYFINENVGFYYGINF